jgi:hypothetical protein
MANSYPNFLHAWKHKPLIYLLESDLFSQFDHMSEGDMLN